MKFLKTKKYSILSNILKYSFVIMFGFILLGNIAFAIVPGNTTGPITPGNTTGGTDITTTIDNPLGVNGPKTIPDFIIAVVNIVFKVGIPIVTLAIIYTGFLFVAAQGSSEKLTKAKKALVYTLIGAALILGALIISKAIQSTVTSIGQGV